MIGVGVDAAVAAADCGKPDGSGRGGAMPVCLHWS